MARGKQTCKILKDIRRQIAAANDIEYVTSECRHKGDCLGTCPKCQTEVRYLEQQLRERSLLGKAVSLAGISAGMILMSGCGSGVSEKSVDNAQNDYDEDYVVDLNVDDIEFGDIIEGEVEGPDEIEGAHNLYWSGDSADVRPQFTGGLKAMEQFLSEQLGKEGLNDFIKMRMKFCVNQNGKVEDIYAGGVGSDKLFKIIKRFPNFIPAVKDGVRVPVYIYATITNNEDGLKIHESYWLKSDKNNEDE